MANRIIAFAGRKESGKTELAKICEEFGYHVISFATPLKTLISELLDISIEEINLLKKVKKNFILNEDKIRYLSMTAQIPLEVANSMLKDKVFETTRDALQFIGTDMIRTFNPSWHIDLTRKVLIDGEKYCFDDLRFGNEKAFIDELNGDCWFVIRPLVNNISNHESEIALLYKDIDNIIINNMPLSYLKFNWHMFFNIGYENSLDTRNKLIKQIKNDNNIYERLFNSEVDNQHFNLIDTLFISKYLFDEQIDIIYERISRIEVLDDFKIKIIYFSDEFVIVDNPLIIENVKLYI